MWRLKAAGVRLWCQEPTGCRRNVHAQQSHATPHLKPNVFSGGYRAIQHKWALGACSAIAFALAYFAVDVALNKFAIGDGWTIVWPLNGVTIALLLKRPRSDWLAMLLGVAVGTGMGECLDNNPLGLEIWQRLFSVTEVVLCACILPSFSTLDQWLRTPHIFRKFLAALVIGPGITGIMAVILWHHANGQSYLLAFNDWALADALGIAVTMPLVLAVSSPQMHSLFRRHTLPRTLGVLALATAGAALIFSESRYPLLFLLYPVLLLVDSLLAFSGSAIAVVAICLLAAFFTTHSLGPFGVWPTDLLVPRDLALQIYLGFHVIALFPASILLMERRRMTEELSDTNARLTVLASLDGLTGIANRRSFDQCFEQEWNRATRSRAPLALIMIDIDHFKQFNDKYGHVCGDRCLLAVAGVLAKRTQRPHDLVARYGGEEFTALLPHTTLEGARQVAEAMRVAILELDINHSGSSWKRVTASMGCAALTPVQGEGHSGLLQLADGALYRAKRLGRNRVETISSTAELKDVHDPGGTTARNVIIRMLKRGGR